MNDNGGKNKVDHVARQQPCNTKKCLHILYMEIKVKKMIDEAVQKGKFVCNSNFQGSINKCVALDNLVYAQVLRDAGHISSGEVTERTRAMSTASPDISQVGDHCFRPSHSAIISKEGKFPMVVDSSDVPVFVGHFSGPVPLALYAGLIPPEYSNDQNFQARIVRIWSRSVLNYSNKGVSVLGPSFFFTNTNANTPKAAPVQILSFNLR